LSSADEASESIGTMASSSISENMSVESSTAMCGGLPLLAAVIALTMLSW
jgi:hypothetical protein